MYQRGIKLGSLSKALQAISGISTVYLRRQTRRGSTHLLLVGQISGLSISRRISDVDPQRPESALAQAWTLIQAIELEAKSGSLQLLSDRRLDSVLRVAKAEVVALERAELIRSSTAQSRLRWLNRGISFLADRSWTCEQRSLHQWILETDRGSRERRERITASRCLARAAGFEFEVKPETRFSTRHAAIQTSSSIDEKTTLDCLRSLSRRDPRAGWALSFCYATGVRLRGALSINPDDLLTELSVGSAVRYWDGKVGRQRQSEAIISAPVDWLSLSELPGDLFLAPWNRIATAEEHHGLERQASRISNKVTTVLGQNGRWVAARYLRRLATRRLLIAGIHPLQVCSAIGTSLPLLQKRYSDLLLSETSSAIMRHLA